MNRKLLLVMVTAVILLSFVLAGCQSGGVAQELYDKVAAQLKDLQEKYSGVQGTIDELQAKKDAAEAELKSAKAKIEELQSQIGGLKDQYELVGATPAETAEKIIKNYYDTHEYSTIDLFMCSDMSSEVWNMLKAQGINAIIVVGDIDASVSDIILSDHAWVLAEVAPGEYLALETTGGYVVPQSQNPLYYRGWYFDSPADLKSHNRLVREYNIRVGIHNTIAAADREVIEEHNQATNQQTADKLKAVHEKLVELIEQQQAELNNLMNELNSLAKVL